MTWRVATDAELELWENHGTPPGCTYRLVAGVGLEVLERPSDLADVVGGLLILAYMIGCPIVIALIWIGR